MDLNLMGVTGELLKLRMKKETLINTLALVNEQIEETEQDMLGLMGEAGIHQVIYNGYIFKIEEKIKAKIKEEKKKGIINVFEMLGYGQLITRTVNSNKLNAYVKEQLEENGGKLPAWMRENIAIDRTETISIKEAR